MCELSATGGSLCEEINRDPTHPVPPPTWRPEEDKGTHRSLPGSLMFPTGSHHARAFHDTRPSTRLFRQFYTRGRKEKEEREREREREKDEKRRKEKTRGRKFGAAGGTARSRVGIGRDDGSRMRGI